MRSIIWLGEIRDTRLVSVFSRIATATLVGFYLHRECKSLLTLIPNSSDLIYGDRYTLFEHRPFLATAPINISPISTCMDVAYGKKWPQLHLLSTSQEHP